MTHEKRERIAGHVGSVSIFLNGFCIGGALAQLALGNLRASAILGIVGSVLGMVMRQAAVIEWHALMQSSLDDVFGAVNRLLDTVRTA